MQAERRLASRLAALCCAVLILAGAPGPALADPVLVFAAQSMADAMQEIAGRFGEATGHKVTISLGASSTMARQIEAGAPAELFVSANQQWMDYLSERDAILPDTRTDIAGNRLVLIAPLDGPPVEMAADLAGLPEILGGERLALGDPAHVPAGIYAEAALRNLGLWDRLADRLAPASNVRDALRFVEQGAAPFGIVYATDAAATAKVRVTATFPETSHPPIRYPAALTSIGDTKAARELLAFLTGPEAAEVLAGYGFTPVVTDP